MARFIPIPKDYPKGSIFIYDLSRVKKIIDEKLGRLSPQFAELMKETCGETCYKKLQESVQTAIIEEAEKYGINKLCLTVIMKYIFNHPDK